MNAVFCSDLQRQIVEAIASGKRSFVIWGFNENCMLLLSNLSAAGLLKSYFIGIIDENPAKQGRRLFDLEVIAPERIHALELDVLVVANDAEKEDTLRRFSSVDDRIPQVILSGTEHFNFRDPVFDEILASCLVKSYANGYENSLIHIFQSIKYLAANNIRGNVAEFGIFKGGTITFIAKALQQFGFRDIAIYGFDIFDGFPKSRSIYDLYRNPKCEFSDFAAVEQYCSRSGVTVVKGDICETHTKLIGVPLMLSFFDTDNYSPSRAAVETCYRETIKGGVLHFDHYISQPQFLYTIGERMAAEEFLDKRNLFHLHGTGTFIKF